MKHWVHQKVQELLCRVSQEMEKALDAPTEENVHNLRTSIRRTRESIAVFKNFFPAGQAKKIRRSMQSVMHLAAEIRNRDIALELLQNSELTAVRLRRALETERERARNQLLVKLAELQSEGGNATWKESLVG